MAKSGYALLGTSDASASEALPSHVTNSSLSARPSGSHRSRKVDIVQFANHMYYVHENSGKAVVDIMRIGDLSNKCSVEFKTEDNSAKAGEKYVDTAGTLTFFPNEEMKQIEIPIVDNAWFEPNLDFKVVLKNPNECILSPTGNFCRITVIDDDVFPSNRYQEDLMSQDAENIGVRLLISFVVFCIKRVPLVGRRTYWNLFLDQFHNVNYLAAIWLNVYLVDVVLIKGPESDQHLWVPGHRPLTAVLVALALTLPKVVLSYIDYCQVGELAVAGKLNLHLKVNIFRKYLHYNDQSYADVSPTGAMTCMDDDVGELVSLGFMVIFQLAQQVVKMAFIFYFLLHKRPASALLLLPYPIAMAVVLNIRYLPTLKLNHKVKRSQIAIFSFARQVFDDLPLIKEYRMRFSAIGQFHEIVAEAGGPLRQFLEYDFRTMLVMPWITNLAIATFIVLGGYLVMIDDLSVGAFLAIIGIYKDAGGIFGAFYEHVKNCYTVIGPLMRVVAIMNMTTDSVASVEQIQERSAGMREQLTGAQAIPISSDGVSRFDKLHIRLRNVTLATDHGGPQHPALQNISVSLPQGKLVAVIGGHGTGKYSLLRLLRGSVMAQSGQVHVPTHLRCICVPRVPQVFESSSLLDNLLIGIEGSYSKPRLLQICKLVGLSGHVYQMLEAQLEEAHPAVDKKLSHGTSKVFGAIVPWYEQMSQSELLKMHIIRALNNNPEVLLLQRPVDEFEADHAARILGLLRSFVDNRGILVSPEEQLVSRPHTVFFTSGQDRERAEVAADVADVVWHLSERGLLQSTGGAPSRSTLEGRTGNKIINSWCQEAQKTHDLLEQQEELQRTTYTTLQVVQTELDTCIEEEEALENSSFLFGIPFTGTSTSDTKVRLTRLRSMLSGISDSGQTRDLLPGQRHRHTMEQAFFLKTRPQRRM